VKNLLGRRYWPYLWIDATYNSDGLAKPPAITTGSLLLQHSPGRDLIRAHAQTVYGK
jgi:hypothetical protein